MLIHQTAVLRALCCLIVTTWLAIGCADPQSNSTTRTSRTLLIQAVADSKPVAHVAGPADSVIRFATFNMALNRPKTGQLVEELKTGSDQASKLAAIVQLVRPHVLLVNEIDYDESHESVETLHEKYFEVAQTTSGGKSQPISYPFRYTASVNTGVPSGLDLDGNGMVKGGGDCFGYGAFPGQYGMAVYSQFPIDNVRTFQNLLWASMPNAALPKQEDRTPFYSDEAVAIFRLSSKSHWDVTLETPAGMIHFLVCHPTPPVFDGPEDRNGRRNHDEIRLLADYISGGAVAEYLIDDNGQAGGLSEDDSFIIAGDLNADPLDGASFKQAVNQLLDHDRVQAIQPSSVGAIEMASAQQGKNTEHKSDPALDTGDFGDKYVGNLRADYVLPSKNLQVVQHGVMWPPTGEPLAEEVKASDHRLVWVDLAIPE